MKNCREYFNFVCTAIKHRLKVTCYHPFLEGIGKFFGFKFGLFLKFPSIIISCNLYFFQNFLPHYFSKQIKNGLGVTEMLYLSMKIIVYYIHQQHLLTILFHINIFFSGNEVLVSWNVSKNDSNKIILELSFCHFLDSKFWW